MALLTMFWNGLVGLLQLVAFPLAKVRGNRRLSQFVRWGLHGLCVALLTACLAYLNHALELESVLSAPLLFLRRLWLPGLFLLTYALGWLCWWLWKLVITPESASAQPDIDAAWQEARQALERAGIDLTATPLYLVLGRCCGGETSLFNSSGLPFSVTGAPRRSDAPLHVWANADGIYVACAETSLIGLEAARFELEREIELATTRAPSRADERPELDYRGARRPAVSDRGGAGVQLVEPAQELLPDFAAALDRLEAGVALLDEPGQAVAPAEQRVAAPDPAPQRRHKSIVASPEVVETTKDRLRHLCALLVRDRRPYCPLNGVLLLLPISTTDGDCEANQAAVLLEQELQTVRESTQIQCPLTVLLCDLEQVEGCENLLSRFPEEQRQRRLGVRFPAVSECDRSSVRRMIEEGLQWTCEGLIRPLIYRLLSANPNAAEPLAQGCGNLQLYRFFQQFRQRHGRAARILIRGLNAELAEWQLRGCYLAATGADAMRGRGFVGGVFPQLSELQNHVAWTQPALTEDASYRRWTRGGYAALAVFTAALVGLLMSI